MDPRINSNKPPQYFRDAMKALDKQAWAAAYNSEFVGFQQRKVFKVVRPEPGVKINNALTRIEYKEDNGEFLKNKVRLCSRGDQQISGVSFQESYLYAPVLKSAEARLLLALAAANGANVVKNDTRQAYLYGDMGDDVVFISDSLTGGQSRFWKDAYSSYSRAFMERGKRLVNGIRTFQHGWSRMNILQ
jgi:hypothetical protein